MANSKFSFQHEDTGSSPDQGNCDYLNAPEINVHPNRVRKLLRNLKPHKAASQDDISPRFFKELAEPLTHILSLIFSLLMKLRKTPGDW